MSFFLTALIMFIFWILLSGHFDFLMLSLGVVSSLLVAYWSHDLFIGKADPVSGGRRVLRLVKYLPWLLGQIMLANVNMVYLTLHPKMPIDPQIVRFSNDLKTGMGIATLANSITLTPGTVTIECGREGFIVHAISKNTAESLLSGEMQARVKEVEGNDV